MVLLFVQLVEGVRVRREGRFPLSLFLSISLYLSVISVTPFLRFSRS